MTLHLCHNTQDQMPFLQLCQWSHCFDGAYKFIKLEADLLLIKGHGGTILDQDLSSFNDNLFSTASADSQVKLLVIPEGGHFGG
eukprot:403362213